ncbi:hypothetical protein M3Y99_00151900 [Aphelenchoides fujianensis]|nr:hypothetical protein M3Y99_00151900 [Aphelenchoides fujianensis]
MPPLAVDPQPKMEPCKHALFLSVRGTALDNGDFYGPQATLPFRYETKCRLMVTNGGMNVGLGETHILYKVKSNDRICCCLELAAVRQENEGFKAEKRQLDTKISELTAAMEKSPETVHELAAVKEKLESVEKEKEVFKQKAEESAAKIAELTDALEQHKKTGEGRAKDAAGWDPVDAK